MFRTAVLASILLVVPAVAHADTYLTLGIGPQPDLNGTLSNYQEDGRVLQASVGKSWNIVSIEGGLQGFSTTLGRELSAQASVKLTAPLSPIVGIYARLGLEKAWFDYDAWDSSGSGHLIGAGVEVSPEFLPFGVFAEIERESLTTYADRGKYEGEIDTAIIGVKLGL
jgi:hypothetical protein